MALVAAAWRPIRETTLAGPWCWSLASLAAIGTVECLAALGILQATLTAWRYVAAVGIFSPWMSVLGAKRPQDQAWHFIVASLWGIQALPAAEVLLLRPGQPLAIVDFRAIFLLVLIGLATLVYIITRFSLASLIAAAGQLVLVWEFLPWPESASSSGRVLVGVALLVTAAAVAWWTGHRKRTVQPFDRLWLDFRDAFGALWSARVMERINAAAVQYQWPVRLSWSGFCYADDPLRKAEIPPELVHDVKQVMVNLLRRFVSNAWIEDRLK